MVTTDTKPVPEEPKSLLKLGTIPMQTLKQNHKKWFKKFANMSKHQVWGKTSKSLIPLIKGVWKKWVFKIKHEGMYAVSYLALIFQKIVLR